ncbi:aminopeptidase A [Knoellia sinensis KCTC 19936]|uniref:Probable cytosol aminopeptidase n=1 Tax=Knoellia sinensis KCTC 19936 TaxID=1385520 RepID=A0A0A0JAV6_9MICO|nr:leucyl aminopeptidase [Knoellia sinensis]KGN33157.1 aminopeptidase A [Knoellia sinensis KCTC 19936]
MPSLNLTTRDAASLKVDALVVGSVSTDSGATLADGHGLPKAAAAHLAAVLSDLEAKAKQGETVRVVAVPDVAANAVVVVGLGPAADVTADVLRSAAGSALRSVATKTSVAVALPASDEAALAAVADGAYAGCYTFDAGSTKVSTGAKAKKAAAPKAGPKISVVSTLGQGKAVKAGVERAAVIGAARDLARDLVNTPPNLLTPQLFVERVKAAVAASSGKVTVTVLDEKALAKGGFGGIVGVGQGSANPPRIVTMSYSPSGSRSKSGGVALVGKGITFDSGGLCIKPAGSMYTMKSDMAGAAAVAASVLAAAELGGPVAVTGYLCLAENMPSGTAQRPGDVVTMRNGTTVEIIDTDAEGRMVLGDGICLAGEGKPDVIVDIATLTGAQMVALGTRIAGVMANDDDFRTTVVAAGAAEGEDSWAMPLPRELRPGLDSVVADMAHKADRWGGMLTAGLFLKEFVAEGIKWAHVDIAGPSFNEGGVDGQIPKGGTGYGVATLVNLVENHTA